MGCACQAVRNLVGHLRFLPIRYLDYYLALKAIHKASRCSLCCTQAENHVQMKRWQCTATSSNGTGMVLTFKCSRCSEDFPVATLRPLEILQRVAQHWGLDCPEGSTSSSHSKIGFNRQYRSGKEEMGRKDSIPGRGN